MSNQQNKELEKHLKWDYTSYENSNVDTGKYGGTKTFTDKAYRYYPNLFAKEKTGWVDNVQGTEINLSEQTSPINEELTQAGNDGIKITQTYWSKSMEEDVFFNEKYYYLFINDGENNYPTYWMSSRCVSASSSYARFRLSYVYTGSVSASYLYRSDNSPSGSAYALRPVITLNSDILIDTTDTTRDGTEAEKAYIIKK